MLEFLTCPHGLGLPHLIGDLIVFFMGLGSAVAGGWLILKSKLCGFWKGKK